MSSTGDTKCPNCINGWVITMKPANKVMIDGKLVYGDDAQGMIEFATPCPICNGGQVVVETIQRKADIPAAMYDVDMDGFDWSVYGTDVEMARKMARSFVLDYKSWKQNGMGLYIWSKTKGSGKTFLASAICNSLIRGMRVRPKFVNVSNLIEMSKDEQTMSDIIYSDLLVIDDLGQKESGVSWVADILYKILDSRMQRKAVTLVTSNYKLDELQVDDRVLDRLNAMTQSLRLPDFSVRTKEANEKKVAMLRELGILPGEQKQTTLELGA